MKKQPGSELRLRLTIPYVLTEVLAVVGRKNSRGLSYDPLSTLKAIPWDSACPKCRAGKSAAPLKTRRAIQTLCTARLTTRKASEPSYDVLVVVGNNTRCHLSTTYVRGEKWIVKVKTRNPRSPVLRRTVTMLQSASMLAEPSGEWHDDLLRKLSPEHPHVPSDARVYYPAGRDVRVVPP